MEMFPIMLHLTSSNLTTLHDFPIPPNIEYPLLAAQLLNTGQKLK